MPKGILAVESEVDRHKRLVEEDLDAILERAEVVGSMEYQHDEGEVGAGGCGGAAAVAGDLLTSFNVATFKNEEDDATFWSRLIPVVSRPKEEHEVCHLCERRTHMSKMCPKFV